MAVVVVLSGQYQYRHTEPGLSTRPGDHNNGAVAATIGDKLQELVLAVTTNDETDRQSGRESVS